MRSPLSAALGALSTLTTLVAAQAGDKLRITIEPNIVAIARGEQPVLRYRHKDVPFKPYVQELFTPGGVNVLRDAPHDHLHHHALMFALRVDGVSFWEETPQAGRQHHRPARITPAPEQTGFFGTLEWISPADKLVLRERREIAVHVSKDTGAIPATLLTWTTRLEAPPGESDVTITGNHYFGLGMRFLQSMDNTGTFLNADGAEGRVFRGDERLVGSRWCAYAASADGKPVTVAMFDHPENIRPVTWFTMKSPFAYLSATLAYHEQPVKIKAGKPLELRYGVAICDGHLKAEQIESLYRRWRTLAKP